MYDVFNTVVSGYYTGDRANKDQYGNPVIGYRPLHTTGERRRAKRFETRGEAIDWIADNIPGASKDTVIILREGE